MLHGDTGPIERLDPGAFPTWVVHVPGFGASQRDHPAHSAGSAYVPIWAGSGSGRYGCGSATSGADRLVANTCSRPPLEGASDGDRAPHRLGDGGNGADNAGDRAVPCHWAVPCRDAGVRRSRSVACLNVPRRQRSVKTDGWPQRLHKWFPFLHTWELFADRDSPWRQCVTCGQMQMLTDPRRRGPGRDRSPDSS